MNPSLSGASRHYAIVEAEARFEKALRIADLIDAAGITSEQVVGFQPERWHQPPAASVKLPSPETHAGVLALLRNREATVRKVRRVYEAANRHATKSAA